MKKTLGNLERQLFAYTQLRNLKTLQTGDLLAPLNITSKQERELLSRLSSAGLIGQVRRGLYLVPSRLPLGGKWSPDEFLALNTLISDQGGRYQICGPNAFNRYGFDDQIPVRTYVYNNRLSGDRTIGSVSFTLIKVPDKRLGDVEEIKTADSEKAAYSSRARSLLDAVYDWSRFNTLPRAYKWINEELALKRITPKELIGVTLKYGDIGTIRRVGFFLEKIGVSNSLLVKLKRAIKPSTSFIPSCPNKPKRGTVNIKWGILDNGIS
jgi:predicted transcriptional regulator of viral defense system